jgi:hypothetical protein
VLLFAPERRWWSVVEHLSYVGPVSPNGGPLMGEEHAALPSDCGLWLLPRPSEVPELRPNVWLSNKKTAQPPTISSAIRAAEPARIRSATLLPRLAQVR